MINNKWKIRQIVISYHIIHNQALELDFNNFPKQNKKQLKLHFKNFNAKLTKIQKNFVLI